jgi:hypothetical protein
VVILLSGPPQKIKLFKKKKKKKKLTRGVGTPLIDILDYQILNREVARGLTPYIRLLDQIRIQHPGFLSWREHTSISIKLTKIERIIVVVRFNKRQT